MNTLPRRVALVAAALALTLAACGSSGGDKSADKTTTTKPKTTTTEKAAETTTTADETTTTAGGGDSGGDGSFHSTATGDSAGDTTGLITKVLLAPEDITGVTLVAKEISELAAPCDSTTDKDIPAFAEGYGQLLDDDAGLGLQESIHVYKDAAEAKSYYDAAVSTGLSCGTATDGSAKISAPEDITSQLQELDRTIDAAATAEITAADPKDATFSATDVVVLYKDSVEVFRFAMKTDADTSKVPSPADIVAKGITKIRDGISAAS